MNQPTAKETICSRQKGDNLQVIFYLTKTAIQSLHCLQSFVRFKNIITEKKIRSFWIFYWFVLSFSIKLKNSLNSNPLSPYFNLCCLFIQHCSCRINQISNKYHTPLNKLFRSNRPSFLTWTICISLVAYTFPI